MTSHANHQAPQGLNQLLEDPQIWRASDALRSQDCARQTSHSIATGFARLNRELPDNGWPSQGLMELLCPRWGAGEIPLLSPAMAQLSQQGRWLVWVSPPWQPYAPGLVHAGINITQILVISPSSERDALWAMEECLQSGQCSAVIGWPRKILPQQLKRLHIAAKKGDSLAVMMRDESCAQQPSPAPLRIQLGALQAELSLRIIKRRGRWASDWLRLPLPECLSLLQPTATVTGDNTTSHSGHHTRELPPDLSDKLSGNLPGSRPGNGTEQRQNLQPLRPLSAVQLSPVSRAPAGMTVVSPASPLPH